MAVTPLTDAQQRAVDALAQAGRLEQVEVDTERCASILTQAAAALGDLPNVRHPQNTYNRLSGLTHRKTKSRCRARPRRPVVSLAA